MKTPKDITGSELAKLAGKYGYEITRQTGSHIRLTTQLNGEYHITIPSHNPLKIGTISSIIKDIAEHLEMDKSELSDELF